ncbi:UNVERIFIED_CONTAM: hypothetical protein FKN15_070636 [Acipenser sinensis]
MEREKERAFARKRSFTFGAYGGKSEDGEHRITDILDSPTQGVRPPPMYPIYQKFLQQGLPVPLILTPKSGGYWIEGPRQPQTEEGCPENTPADSQDLVSLGYALLERDPTATVYRENFLGKEHHNFYAVDSSLGGMVLSVQQVKSDTRDNLHLILRTRNATLHDVIPASCLCEVPNAIQMAKFLQQGLPVPLILTPKSGGYWIEGPRQPQTEEGCPENTPADSQDLVSLGYALLERDPTATVYRENFLGKASQLIVAFDEHLLSNNFKFGVLYQREGQLQRKRHIGNDIVCLVYQEGHVPFLPEIIASNFLHAFIVVRRERGGEGYEVSITAREDVPYFGPALPDPPLFTEGSELREFLLAKLINAEVSCYRAEKFKKLELQRKRHIGNDIVCLVYQEGHVPFLPEIIASNFLHAFIVVRRERGGEGYEVSITAREDVPYFGPALPDPPLFTEGSELREFLLAKLINAEVSCYRAEKFKKLEERTRGALLDHLYRELSAHSQCMLGVASASSSSSSSSEGAGLENGGATVGGGFLENFKAVRVTVPPEEERESEPANQVMGNTLVPPLPHSSSNDSGCASGVEGHRRQEEEG